MGTPIPAATHPLLGTPRRVFIALTILVVALAAVITTVLLLQSDTTAPSVVDRGNPGVSDTAPPYGSADVLEGRAG
jgi:hypothetical protein